MCIKAKGEQLGISVTKYLAFWSPDYFRDVQVRSKFIFRNISNFQSSKAAIEEQKLREKNVKQRKERVNLNLLLEPVESSV